MNSWVSPIHSSSTLPRNRPSANNPVLAANKIKKGCILTPSFYLYCAQEKCALERSGNHIPETLERLIQFIWMCCSKEKVAHFHGKVHRSRRFWSTPIGNPLTAARTLHRIST